MSDSKELSRFASDMKVLFGKDWMNFIEEYIAKTAKRNGLGYLYNPKEHKELYTKEYDLTFETPSGTLTIPGGKTMFKKKKVLYCDVDGVLRNFIGKLEEVYDRELVTRSKSGPSRVPVVEWDLHKFFSIGKDIYDFAFNKHAAEIFGKAEAYPNAVEDWGLMQRIFDEIWIVTNQPSPLHQVVTLEWLREHGFEYDGIIFTGNGLDKRLPVYLNSKEEVWYVDDSIKNLASYGRDKMNGVDNLYLMKRKWNQDVGHGYDTITRLADLLQRIV